MSQAFDSARLRPLKVRLAGAERALTTVPGIFSPDGIDKGTAVLFDYVPAPPREGNLLDIGCGWGAIALTMALESPEANVWAVDINEQCVRLTDHNAELLGLGNVRAGFPNDVPEGLQFEAIWSNPPIRIGKAELHALLLHWLPRLAVGGSAWLVVQKNLGADSLSRWLKENLGTSFSVSREATAKAFRVLKVTRERP